MAPRIKLNLGAKCADICEEIDECGRGREQTRLKRWATATG